MIALCRNTNSVFAVSVKLKIQKMNKKARKKALNVCDILNNLKKHSWKKLCLDCGKALKSIIL